MLGSCCEPSCRLSDSALPNLSPQWPPPCLTEGRLPSSRGAACSGNHATSPRPLHLAMDSVFGDDVSIIAQETLVQEEEEEEEEEEDWVDSPNTDQSGDMCSASHFALITAYGDIKERLSSLERENATLRRKLKVYEIKYPIISEFGDENFSPYDDGKEDSLLRTEASQHELQNNQEKEEQLGEIVRACEKMCAERSELHEELSEMKGLVLTHVAHIQSLEQQLQMCTEPHPFPGSALTNPNMQYLSLHHGPDMSHVLEHAMNWQAPRSLDLQRDMAAQRRDAELEEARRDLQNAQRREKQLKEDILRLEEELKQLQEAREQVRRTCKKITLGAKVVQQCKIK